MASIGSLQKQNSQKFATENATIWHGTGQWYWPGAQNRIRYFSASTAGNLINEIKSNERGCE